MGKVVLAAAAELTKAELDAIKVEAYKGTDPDLAPADKRSRAEAIAGSAVVVPNAILTVGERVPVTVLGPGRGKDYFVAAWKDPLFSVPCIGSFRVREIKP